VWNHHLVASNIPGRLPFSPDRGWAGGSGEHRIRRDRLILLRNWPNLSNPVAALAIAGEACIAVKFSTMRASIHLGARQMSNGLELSSQQENSEKADDDPQ